MIRTDKDTPEFAAIIDADRAIWGDTDFKYSSIQWTYGEESFWEGYGCPLLKGRPHLIRRSIYTLLGCLWDAYVFLIEYNQPENADDRAREARKQVTLLKELL